MQKKYSEIIDFVFYAEKKIRESIEEHLLHPIRPEIKNSSYISDPTARDALKNIEPIPSLIVCGRVLKFPEKWVAVIEKTYAWCKRQSETHYQAVHRYYREKKSNGHYKKICQDLSISTATFYNFIDKAKMYAALNAAQFNLIYFAD